MAATKIRVTFKSVTVLNDADWFGPGEWYFSAEVRRLPSNSSRTLSTNERFEANQRETIALDWTGDFDVKPGDQKLEIRLHGKDEDVFVDDDLGTVRVVLNVPIVQEYDLSLQSSSGHYTARIQVKILEETSKGKGKITTLRQTFESDTYSTIHDGAMERLVHICPVIPLPPEDTFPPMPAPVAGLTAFKASGLHILATHADPNSLVNPALIPVLSASDKDLAKKCARLKVTQYRPKDLDTGKLIWKAATGNVRFWHGGSMKQEVKGGTEVLALGVLTGDNDEQCKIEVRWDSEGQPLLTEFRAWVGKIKYIWCRANIIKYKAPSGSPAGTNPTFTKGDVQKHIHFCNLILWQSGIQLAMDTDETPYNGAKKLDTGIFEIESTTDYTFNVPSTTNCVAPMLNSREGVFNLAYIHSVFNKPTLLGSASDRRLSAAEGHEELDGTPSASWIRPTGLWPDEPAKAIRLKRMGPSRARDASQKPLCGDGAIEKLSACIMTENCKRNIATGEVTLPHELGHVIGLNHRGLDHRGAPTGKRYGSYDEVSHLAGPRKDEGHPWLENLMTYGNDRQAQDIDMIQTLAIRKHALLRKTPPTTPEKPAPPPPPPPPPEPKRVPEAWLPNAEEVTLLQEYLTGKRPGLTHCGYDLGASGPDGDGVDGINGTKTKAGIRSFQRDHGGLEVDGVYGPKTAAAFEEELNPKT